MIQKLLCCRIVNTLYVMRQRFLSFLRNRGLSIFTIRFIYPFILKRICLFLFVLIPRPCRYCVSYHCYQVRSGESQHAPFSRRPNPNISQIVQHDFSNENCCQNIIFQKLQIAKLQKLHKNLVPKF